MCVTKPSFLLFLGTAFAELAITRFRHILANRVRIKTVFGAQALPPVGKFEVEKVEYCVLQNINSQFTFRSINSYVLNK